MKICVKASSCEVGVKIVHTAGAQFSTKSRAHRILSAVVAQFSTKSRVH